MKFLVSAVLTIAAPVFAHAGLAGDWVGVHNTPAGPRHIVLHLRGEDTALKATSDSPDQGAYGIPVPSVTLMGPTLQFSIPVFDVTYSGELHSDGTIAGTFIQHGLGTTLVFARAAAGLPPPPTPTLTGPAGSLQGQHYHHNLTGVEFDLPYGWSIGRTRPADGDPNKMTVLVDPSRKAVFASVFMSNENTAPAYISGALTAGLKTLLARRSGATGAHAPHVVANYTIRPGSEEQTAIGGRQALRAIGEYELGGKKMAELLTWIDTEHTRTFFFAQMAAEDLPAVQAQYEQMLQSASIP